MLMVSACNNSQNSSDTTINTLLIGVLPDQNEESLQNRYQPLINYLEKSTGLDCQLFTPASYNELLEWFHTGKINMACSSILNSSLLAGIK